MASLEAFPEAFPRAFPTGLSPVPPCCESILGLKVEAVQGKQVSLEWTETSGGPNIPVSTGEEARESRPHSEEPRIRLRAREEGYTPCVVRKEFPAFPSHVKWMRSP